MDAASIRAELDDERLRRIGEMSFLRNIQSGIAKPEDRERFCRAMVLMLYAHLEGFAGFALTAYVKAVNVARIPAKDAHPMIMAASWHKLFGEIISPVRDHVFGKYKLPDAADLRAPAARCYFACEIRSLLEAVVVVPDEVVDTESNLNAQVLRKNLYRVGLAPEIVDAWVSCIEQLVSRRHRIAHGEDMRPVEEAKYDVMFRAAVNVMEALSSEIMSALVDRRFELAKQASGPPT